MKEKIKSVRFSSRVIFLFLIIGIIFTFQATVSRSIPSTTKSFTPITDTYINLENADLNYGGQETLRVGYSSESDTWNNKALLAFDLSTLPDDILIQSVSLGVYWIYVPETFNMSVCLIGAFDEYYVTWFTSPSFSNTSIDSILVGSALERPYWNLSSISLSRDILYLGIFTTTNTLNFSTFSSREGDNSIVCKIECGPTIDYRPKLDVVYTYPVSNATQSFELLIGTLSLSALVIIIHLKWRK